MSTPILSCRDLEKVYKIGRRTIPVLKGIDLDILAGTTTAITGQSGSGKSTLLHLMGLLDKPTAGSILFEGNDVRKIGRTQRKLILRDRIGFVFQAFHLFKECSVIENITLADRARQAFGFPTRDAADRARVLAERLGLGHRLDHRPMELSGGEQQRVAIARALLNQPDLILADEPTGNLDDKTGGEIIEALFDLVTEQGATFVMVTHNRKLAEMCQSNIQLA